MWFGTQNGLNRYDGYNFKIYKSDIDNPNTSLTSNFVRALAVDKPTGKLWIGTNNGGISLFNPETETFENYRHDPKDHLSLPHDMVRSIFIDHSDTVWVGTGNGLARYDRKDKRFQQVSIPVTLTPSSPLVIRSIVEDKNKTLWIGTTYGVFKRTINSETFEKHSLLSSTSSQDISTLFVDNESQHLWIGTISDGIIRLNLSENTTTRFAHDESDPFSLSHNAVLDIIQIDNNEIWVGTSRGLNIYSPEDNNTFIRYLPDPADNKSLSSSNIETLLQDEAGVVWVGSWTDGLNKTDPYSTLFKTINPDNKRGNPGLAEDLNGNVWFATHNGLYWLSSDNKVSEGLYHHPDTVQAKVRNEIIGVSASKIEPVIWLGTRRGLSRYRVGEQWIEPVALDGYLVYSVFEANDGTVWAGTYNNGLFQLDRNTFKEIRRIPSSLVPDIYQDDNGVIWAGSTNGLYRIEGDSPIQIFRHQETTQNSLSHNTVTWISKDSKSNYWIGTQGGGINKMTFPDDDYTSPDFTHYSIKDGFDSEAIGSIIEDKSGTFWVSTTSGISRFNPESMDVDNFSDSEGANKGGYYVGSGILSSNGNIYFGGPHGLTEFDPNQVQLNQYKPSTRIVSFRLFNQPMTISANDDSSPLTKPIYLTETLNLSSKDSVISFEFSSSHYSAPKNNRYAYMLDGFDHQWNHVSSNRRFATYTNLSPGQYTLKVKGTNKDGIWGEPTELTLVINPQWWQTKTFILMVVVSCILIMLTIYRWRVQWLRQQSINLRKMVKEQTEELRIVNRRLEKTSKRDFLTKLSNRRDFIDLASKEFFRYKRHGNPFCIILFDIDYFKKVNDEYGHDAGDQALIEISKITKTIFRSEDIIARWGGEEFIILLPETPYQGGLVAAEKIRAKVESLDFYYQETKIPLNITVGVSVVSECESLKACIVKADEALYEGKSKGRNCVV
ncbi:hypothetical protein GCM10023151_05000 [Kangiella marina]|uniref:diguanylate cyclase n=2 Tax=Kangiella marina TaxID=1079178 RepID=A0ABP8IDV5_9GAMM